MGSVLPPGSVPGNPWNQVPSLRTPEGETITEVAACLLHLDRHHRSEPIFCQDNPGRLSRWAVFLSVNLYEPALTMTYPTRYLDPGDAAWGKDALSALKRTTYARFTRALAVIEATLGEVPALSGSRPGAADVYLAMIVSWFPPATAGPRTRAVCAAVTNQDPIAQVWESHGLRGF
ncbi:MAG: glutathione S-transferase family protein [Pseudomonadota bacterium]